MQFLKDKFADTNDYIDTFLGSGNTLLSLESTSALSEKNKALFVTQFLKYLTFKQIFDDEVLSCVTDANAWSIDFPGWHGTFNEQEGKKIFIVGSEPHIWNKYLQTVYAFNNENTLDEYLNNKHPLFNFISQLVAGRYSIVPHQALQQCYITDLFPVAPYRGNGIAVGSTDKLQKVIGNNKKWRDIRFAYAKENLPLEISGVKPELIITQGKEVFQEVIKILAITDKVKISAIEPEKGKKQYVRSVKWNNKLIVSVPHIGSQRMRTFWTNNIEQVKNVFSHL